jgi:N-methylhydantoinase A
MRYEGQGYEIQVPIPGGRLGEEDLAGIRESFNKAYRGIYQRLGPEVTVEALNWRLVASGRAPELNLVPPPGDRGGPEKALKGKRTVYFAGSPITCPIYERASLAAGAYLRGPAVVEERESTVVIPPRWEGHVDDLLNLTLKRT